MKRNKSILWCARFDPDYGRNRVIRAALVSLGWKLIDFRPFFSSVGHWQAILGRNLKRWNEVSAVWVPCFRHRDFASAHEIAGHLKVPLIFDPLISAYDKQVFERRKFSADSPQAKRLLAWESSLFRSGQVLVADTKAHAEFFIEQFGVSPGKVHVIPVGADKSLFTEQPWAVPLTPKPLQVLFYGSFLGLQGPEVIVEAASLTPETHWVMLGDGPLKETCKNRGRALSNLQFVSPVPFDELPSSIAQADVVLGVFGSSDKASRVIPNKVHQGMACGRSIVTRKSEAYPKKLLEEHSKSSGVFWTSHGNPSELAEIVRSLHHEANDRKVLQILGAAARVSHEKWFGHSKIEDATRLALSAAGLNWQ